MTKRWIVPAAITAAAIGGVSAYALLGRRCHRFPVSVGPATIEDVERDRRGITLWVRFHEAPFDADRLSVIFIPRGARALAGCVNIALHWHGHNAFVPTKVVQHALREQVADSGRNVVFVMPQTAILTRDSSAGRFDRPGQFDRFIAEVLATLNEVAPGRFRKNAGLGRLMVSTHSGGFRVTARILDQRGDAVDEVILYDSLYAEVDSYVEWAAREGAQRPIRLVNLHLGDNPERKTAELHEGFQTAGVPARWVQARSAAETLPTWMQASQTSEDMHEVANIRVSKPEALTAVDIDEPTIVSVDMRPTGQLHTWLPLGVFETMLRTSAFPRWP